MGLLFWVAITVNITYTYSYSLNSYITFHLLFCQVFVGRPALWGLTVAGQAGVQKMLSILRTELEYAFQIAGKFHLDIVVI